MTNHRLTIAAASATVLASVALYPIFATIGWFYQAAGAVVVVAAAGTLTRRRPLPPVLCVLAALAALLLYLNLVYEPGSTLVVVPTPESLSRLVHLAAQGMNQAALYAPPVPPVPGILVLSTGGIGLAAVLTDLIGVRLCWTALAGLPLLLLFIEPFMVSATRSSIGTVVVFCLAAAGYLSMLSSDGRDRIKVWGRSMPVPEGGPDTTALAATGRRVGLLSVIFALCIPLIVPGQHATRLFSGGWSFGGSGDGGTAISLPDPFTTLHGELAESNPQPVLTYTTSDSKPGYLQVNVLDDLTTSGWRYNPGMQTTPVGIGLPPAPGLTGKTATQSETTNITIARNVNSPSSQLTFLPLPYPATRVISPGNWSVDPNTLMMVGREPLAGLSYTVVSEQLRPTAAELSTAPAPAIGKYYLQVPASYRSLSSLARSVTAGADSGFAKANALQDWFNGSGQFTYTLDSPEITDAGSLRAFLKSRHGYCQQFAYAMAVMARLLGIPSRMAIGYTQGRAEGQGTWVVKTTDAHAWPELYFQGAGWIPFEPTPAGVQGQGTATPPSYTSPATTAPTPTSPATTPTQSPGQTGTGDHNVAHPHINPGLGDSGIPGAGAISKPNAEPWILAGLGLLVLLLLVITVPGIARVAVRRRRWRPSDDDALAALAAWRELRDDLTDFRVGYTRSESPRALASRISRKLQLAEPASAALGRVAMAQERAQYSARPVPAEGLRKDSALVHRAIATRIPGHARWRARLFPASVLSPAACRIGRSVELLGRINARLPQQVNARLPWRRKSATS